MGFRSSFAAICLRRRPTHKKVDQSRVDFIVGNQSRAHKKRGKKRKDGKLGVVNIFPFSFSASPFRRWWSPLPLYTKASFVSDCDFPCCLTRLPISPTNPIGEEKNLTWEKSRLWFFTRSSGSSSVSLCIRRKMEKSRKRKRKRQRKLRAKMKEEGGNGKSVGISPNYTYTFS